MHRLREAQRLTQDEVAALSATGPWPISRGEISSIERGRHIPSLTSLIALSRVLGFDAREALERVEAEPPFAPELGPLPMHALSARADERSAAGDFRGALAYLGEMQARAQLDPLADERVRSQRRAEIELRSARERLRAGAILAARTSAEHAINLAVDSPGLQSDGYRALTDALVDLENHQMAIDAADRAVGLAEGLDERSFFRALMAKGRALRKAGRYDRARSAYLEARKRPGAARQDEATGLVEAQIGLFRTRPDPSGKVVVGTGDPPYEAGSIIGARIPMARRARPNRVRGREAGGGREPLPDGPAPLPAPRRSVDLLPCRVAAASHREAPRPLLPGPQPSRKPQEAARPPGRRPGAPRHRGFSLDADDRSQR